ncbi:MAG: zf-HC2 domain-containing protein [Bacteroidetes bacterium]|nr:zf-HC2 domain-containing protein [Bacteroidota bacterium]
MSHKQMQLLISSYIDGEIDAGRKKKVLEHLKTCQECRQFVDEAGEIRKQIKALDEIELPHAFSERIAHLAVKSEEETKDWLGIEPLARNTFIAIATAVVILFFVTDLKKEASPSIMEILNSGQNGDSAVTQVLLHPGELSKNDLLLAVMTK